MPKDLTISGSDGLANKCPWRALHAQFRQGELRGRGVLLPPFRDFSPECLLSEPAPGLSRFGYRTGSAPGGGSNSWPVQCTAPLVVKAQ